MGSLALYNIDGDLIKKRLSADFTIAFVVNNLIRFIEDSSPRFPVVLRAVTT